MTFRFSTNSLALLLALLARSSVAAAQEPAPTSYERHMDLGVRLFEDRNYDAALPEFELAYAEKKVASPLINLAICHKGRFEYPRAVEYLERALRDHRDSIEAPEKIERAITELRELLAVLQVRVEPAGIPFNLTLDGDELPLQPKTSVSPGSHTVIARADGYAEARASLRIASGEQRSIVLTLIPTSGMLKIEAPDDQVSVTVDGVAKGAGRYQGRLEAGTHLLVIERDGDRYSLSVPIVAAAETKVVITSNGFVRVGEGTARGPDEVERPPIRGIYAELGGLFGAFAGAKSAPFGGFDVIGGYQVANSVGIDIRYIQGFVDADNARTPDNQVVNLSSQLPFSTSQVGAGVRFMTNTPAVRFVQSLHFGAAMLYFPEARSTAYGAFLALEPELDIELSRFLFGFGTPLVINILPDASAQPAIRLHFGYGFW